MVGGVLEKLRLTAGCAIAGAALTGATLGHHLGGRDPSDYGAAAGLALGLLAWTRGAFDRRPACRAIAPPGGGPT